MFISQKIVRENGIKKLTIKTEPDYQSTSYQGQPKGDRMTCVVETDVANPKEATWQMNKARNNHLKKLYGDDTLQWIGKTVEVAVKQAGSMSPSVYPADCSLEKTLS